MVKRTNSTSVNFLKYFWLGILIDGAVMIPKTEEAGRCMWSFTLCEHKCLLT